MPSVPGLPPAPVNATCPLWLLVEWAEVFRNVLASRSTVLLGVEPGETAPGERWLVLATWDLSRRPLLLALPSALRRDYRKTFASTADDRVTVAEHFNRMKAAGQTVGRVDLLRWGGAAFFIRKAADDPALVPLLAFNRPGRRPRVWRLPRPRHYPAELREAYATRSAGSEATFAPADDLPPSSRPRRPGDAVKGGTPQA